MPNYYLDIETTGLNPKEDKIITIQFAPLNWTTSEPIGDLIILKEWESSEVNIIKEFIERSGITSEDPFAFVPVGQNLGFEHNFFLERCAKHGLKRVDILGKPFIDLKTCAILMNRGMFKGSGLHDMAGKPNTGEIVPKLYAEKNYEEIINYIKGEFQAFVNLAKWLYVKMPALWNEYRSTQAQWGKF